MKKTVYLWMMLICTLLVYAEEFVTKKDGKQVVLYDDHTWAEVQDIKVDNFALYKDKLRKGISADEKEIQIACEIYAQGWRYTMPRPKSNQAAWGNRDKRTTWFYGWWYNEKTGEYSDATPQKTKSGLYKGDSRNNAHSWRNGGSPSYPDIYMYLLSSSGGPL